MTGSGPQITHGREFEIRGPTYTQRVRVLAPDFVYFEREQRIRSAGSQIEAFGPSWVLAIAEARIAIRTSEGLVSGGGPMAIFIPPFEIVEWVLSPGELRWTAFMSERTLPPGLPSRAVLFPWKEKLLPRSLAEIHSALRRAGPFTPVGKSGSAIASRLKREIDSSYRTDARIADLARRIGVSRVVMGRAFKSAYGLTPVAYRSRLRVFDSLRRLRQGSDVTTAGFGSGFANLSQYQRQFRSHLATPPLQFCLGKKRPHATE